MQQTPAQQNQPSPETVFKEAHHLFRMGDVFEASKRAGKLRHHFPDGIPFLALHGFVLAKMGVHPQALSDLIKAAQMTEHALMQDSEAENPARPRIVDQLIRLSVQICRSSLAIDEVKAAEEAVELALKWDPDRGDAVAAKAELQAYKGEQSEALATIAQGIKDKLDELPLVLTKAKILLDAQDPDTKALKELIGELETQSNASGLGAMDLGDLLRAIGDANDRIGEHDAAFHSYRRAANLRRGQHDPRAHTMMTTKLIHDWTSETMAKMTKPEQSGERFVLVLGSPHSGANELIEMLGQIDDVRVLGPLETLSFSCIQHLGAKQGVLRPVPFEPSKIRGGQLKDASNAYTTQVSAMLRETDIRGIDTHPLNIPIAGAASAFLPGINIVMCRRDPMESTVATYCDAMVGNHPYAGDLLNAAGFVGDCNRVMDHWADTLGSDEIGANIVSVDYSDLVGDPKKAAAKVAREIGLDARATAIKKVPTFDRGPGAHPDAYAAFTKPIAGFFDPASV